MKKFIVFFMSLSFIVGLIGCKENPIDDPIDDPTDTTTTITGKVNGADFTPTSSNFSQNEMGGITMVISNSEIVISISTTDKVVGIYTITTTKSINSNTATAIIYKNGIAYNATTGSIEIISLSNDYLTGNASITATSGSNNLNVTDLTFGNITNTDLTSEVVGTYNGYKSMVLDTNTYVYVDVPFIATVIKNSINSINVKIAANNNEFPEVNYNNYLLKQYIWQEYKENPLDTTTFITVLHNTIKIGKLESITDSLGNINYRWENLGDYENKVLDISNYHCIKP